MEQNSSCHCKSRFYSFYISALGSCGKVLIVRIELVTVKKHLKKRIGQGKEEETFSGGRDLQPLSSLTA